MSKENIVPMLRLLVMMAGTKGQDKEIEALLEVLDGSDKFMTIANEVIMTIALNKSSSLTPEQTRAQLNESYRRINSGLNSYVNEKTRRIRIYLMEFEKMDGLVAIQPRKEELEKLLDDWNKIKSTLDKFEIPRFARSSKKGLLREGDLFKKNILSNVLPLTKKFTKLENDLQTMGFDKLNKFEDDHSDMTFTQLIKELRKDVWNPDENDS